MRVYFWLLPCRQGDQVFCIHTKDGTEIKAISNFGTKLLVTMLTLET